MSQELHLDMRWADEMAERKDIPVAVMKDTTLADRMAALLEQLEAAKKARKLVVERAAQMETWSAV